MIDISGQKAIEMLQRLIGLALQLVSLNSLRKVLLPILNEKRISHKMPLLLHLPMLEDTRQQILDLLFSVEQLA